MTQPPAFPARLLRRLVPGQDHDVLLGDLCEEYQRRQSVVWYCLQILAAILVGSWKDISTHKVVALRAGAVGLVSLLLIGSVFDELRHVLPRYWPQPYSWSFYVTFRVLSIAAGMTLGWIVVRLHWAHGLTMLLAFRGAWMVTTAGMFLWYAILFAFRPDRAALLSSLAGQFQAVVVQNFVISSFLMLAGGYIATRRPDAA